VAPVSIGFGVVLVVLGLGFYFATGQVSPTALIPAGFGTVLALLGAIALKERMRKHAMHLAAMVGLVGFLVPAVMALPKLPALLSGEAARPAAVVEQLIMAGLCLVFVLLCVRSFIVARMRRARNEPAP
jgi:lysylphosphatidylglycerol synthetase-like protein (DUF2156 family)